MRRPITTGKRSAPLTQVTIPVKIFAAVMIPMTVVLVIIALSYFNLRMIQQTAAEQSHQWRTAVEATSTAFAIQRIDAAAARLGADDPDARARLKDALESAERQIQTLAGVLGGAESEDALAPVRTAVDAYNELRLNPEADPDLPSIREAAVEALWRLHQASRERAARGDAELNNISRQSLMISVSASAVGMALAMIVALMVGRSIAAQAAAEDEVARLPRKEQIDHFEAKMREAAEAEQFEKAAYYRDRIRRLKNKPPGP